MTLNLIFSKLSFIIGEDNVEDIKKWIADTIVSEVEDDMKIQNNYVFYLLKSIKGLWEKHFIRSVKTNKRI